MRATRDAWYVPSLLHLCNAYLSKATMKKPYDPTADIAEFAEGADDKFLMAVVANLPGGVHLELYDFDQALNSLESYETACRMSRWTEPRGHALTKAGLAYFALGDFDLADKFFSVRRSCSKTKTSLSAGVGRWYCCAAAGNWPSLADSATKHGIRNRVFRPRE